MIRRLASGTWCRSSAPEGALFISPSVKGPVFPPPIPVVGPALFPDLGGRVDGVCLVLSRPGCSKLKHRSWVELFPSNCTASFFDGLRGEWASYSGRR